MSMVQGIRLLHCSFTLILVQEIEGCVFLSKKLYFNKKPTWIEGLCGGYDERQRSGLARSGTVRLAQVATQLEQPARVRERLKLRRTVLHHRVDEGSCTDYLLHVDKGLNLAEKGAAE